MYSLTDTCFLCLVHTKSLTSTLSEDDDGIVLEQKLKCFLIEYVHFKPEMIKYVCMPCFGNVNNLYSFRQQCLRNMTTLNDYFDKLAIEAPPYKHFLEVKPDNQTIAGDLSMEIETKQELKCEELDIEESDPPNEGSIQKTFEVNIVVKNEPQNSFEDDKFIKDDTIENFELSEDNGGDEDFVNESAASPPDIVESENNASLELLSQISKEVYENAYRRFMNWRKDQNVSSFSENVIIAYFAYLSTKIKPSTLWGHYSMLKATLNVKNNIDLKKYTKLIPYLKRKSDGYRPKKSKTLTREEINKFFLEAPNEKYLMTKIALIFGIAGALRRDELCKIKTEDISDLGSALLIKIPNTKTKKPKSFTVTGDHYLELFRQYVALRPSNFNESRFFIKYQNGKCHKHVVGIHKLASTAQDVAAYLKLPDLKSYTGHCLRLTSATLLVNAGADLTALKRHVCWQSILDLNSSTSQNSDKNYTSISSISNANTVIESNPPSCAPINIDKCSNCTITFNVNNQK